MLFDVILSWLSSAWAIIDSIPVSPVLPFNCGIGTFIIIIIVGINVNKLLFKVLFNIDMYLNYMDNATDFMNNFNKAPENWTYVNRNRVYRGKNSVNQIQSSQRNIKNLNKYVDNLK